MNIDELVDELLDAPWLGSPARRAIIAKLREQDARLQTAEELATRCDTILKISNEKLSLPFDPIHYGSWDDVNMILDLGLQKFRAVGKEIK